MILSLAKISCNVLGKTQDAHTHRYRVPVILKKRMPLYSTKSRVKIPLAPVKENSSHPEGAGETGLCGSFSPGRWSIVQGNVRQVRWALAPELL